MPAYIVFIGTENSDKYTQLRRIADTTKKTNDSVSYYLNDIQLFAPSETHMTKKYPTTTTFLLVFDFSLDHMRQLEVLKTPFNNSLILAQDPVILILTNYKKKPSQRSVDRLILLLTQDKNFPVNVLYSDPATVIEDHRKTIFDSHLAKLKRTIITNFCNYNSVSNYEGIIPNALVKIYAQLRHIKHSHPERATAVLKAIKKSPDFITITNILRNQSDLLTLSIGLSKKEFKAILANENALNALSQKKLRRKFTEIDAKILDPIWSKALANTLSAHIDREHGFLDMINDCLNLLPPLPEPKPTIPPHRPLHFHTRVMSADAAQHTSPTTIEITSPPVLLTELRVQSAPPTANGHGSHIQYSPPVPVNRP